MLLPEFQETNPGNPCHNYLKCFMEQQKFFFDKETVQRREKLLALPLDELPAKELLDYGGFALCARPTGPPGSTRPTGRSGSS